MAAADDIACFAGWSRTRKYLVGVSGGADSVALLHAMHTARFRKLVVCHLDHGLRGKSAREDATFVARLAKRLGLPCEIGRADVAARVAAGEGSMETVARAARLEFFGRCAQKHRCWRVVLAHHADDQAETVLWNMLRGSHGLRGMAAACRMRVGGGRELELLRPLLGRRHAELVAWLRARNLRWREDATNAEPVAVRNRLRNEALPMLAEISGRDPVAVLVRGADDFREMSECFDALVEEAKVTDPQGRLHLGALRAVHPVVARHAMAGYLATAGTRGISRDLLDRAVAMLSIDSPASLNLPSGNRLRRTAGRLWVEVCGE